MAPTASHCPPSTTTAQLLLLLLLLLAAASHVHSFDASLLAGLAGGGGGGGGGACKFVCPDPSHKPRPNRDYVPTTNGCGTDTFKVSTKFEFTPCCDEHDYCYQKCGEGQAACDRQFLKCLKASCARNHAAKADDCVSQASIFHMGVSLFGCQAYQDSQRSACLCSGKQPAVATASAQDAASEL